MTNKTLDATAWSQALQEMKILLDEIEAAEAAIELAVSEREVAEARAYRRHAQTHLDQYVLAYARPLVESADELLTMRSEQ